MKYTRINNKGFSLVELIIVIAIMAILVGVMAPQLIKYLEKSKVTSDQGLLNAICAAVTYAAMDPDVLEEEASKNFIDSCVSTPSKLESIPTGTRLYDEVVDTLGWPDLQPSTYMKHIKSAHTGSSAVYMQYKGSVDNPIALWITCTDFTGGRDTSENTTSSYKDINLNIAID